MGAVARGESGPGGEAARVYLVENVASRMCGL